MAWKLDLRRFNTCYVNPANNGVKNLFKNALINVSCCDLCGANISKSYLLGHPLQQSLLCQNCINDLPYFNQKLVVGNLLNWPAIHQALPNIYFERLFALSPYVYPFNKWLAQMKYLGRFELANLFSTLLGAQWQGMMKVNSCSPIDLVISVPLHLKKWQVRGYNQSHLIAKYFAKEQSLPYDADLMIRIKNNDSQMGKTGSQRRNNLANAFTLQHKLASHVKHVLIIDDVVTTGTTASEMSKLLKNMGVETVTLVAVCLTLPKGNNRDLIQL